MRELKFEPPQKTRFERIISSAIKKFEYILFNSIYKATPSETLKKIDTLLSKLSFLEISAENKKEITFNELKRDPGRVGLESIFLEIKKLKVIRNLSIPDDIFENMPLKVLKKYKQRVSSELFGEIKRHPDEVKYSLLSIYFWLRGQEITDNLIDLLISIIHKIDSKAVKKVEKEFLNDIKRVHGKYNILRRIAELSLENPEERIKDIIYPSFDITLLKDLIKDLKANNSTFINRVYTVMKNSFSRHYRRMLPELLEILEFKSNNETHRPVLDAIIVVDQYSTSSIRTLVVNDQIPIEGVVSSKWQNDIISYNDKGEKTIGRINYEMCVLQSLREKLRCKEIWVPGANKYKNPEKDLPSDFELNREEYYEMLKQPNNADEFISKIKDNMKAALYSFNKNISQNEKVKVSTFKGGRVTITPSDPQEEPMNITALKSEILQKWPIVSLLDVMKETDFFTNFTSHFKTSGTREQLDRETIKRRLLLTLFGLGTNTGLKRISKASNIPESYEGLRYLKRKFINKDNLRNAIVEVANKIINERKESIWGNGTSCASDSKKFGAWDQNLMTEWHIRYRGRGVMIYWHVEKNSTCIYSQLKNCSSSEVSAMIEGVLKHCTELNIERNYVDSHGQSEVAFAFSHLLNFSLMPRFKNINKQKLYVPDNSIKNDLNNIAQILTRNIDWELIRKQYDQMIKYTTALKIGTAETEAIMKRFTRNNIKHPTYKALQELGKVVKTIFLCEYFMSEDLRIEINEGLNVVENWNSANSFIFFGKSGEIQSNNIEDQEISVLSLHLLQNCLVYINTLMIQEVLSKKEWKLRMQVDDYRALTPLIYQHINPYGKFFLDMDERIPIKDVA